VRLLGEASYDVLTLTFFAQHNTHVPMWATLGWMILNAGLSVLLVGPFGIAGLAWAASIAGAALAAALLALNLRVGGVDVPMVRAALGRATVGSLGMCGVVLLLHQLRLPPALFILASAGSGGIAFFGIYVLLGGSEVLTVLGHLRRGLQSRISLETHSD
jgi:putative peptidoglycan lipid II flippase